MALSDLTKTDAGDSLIKGLLGFFGVVFSFLFLPKILKVFFRKFFFGLIAEVAAIVAVGLLTERFVDQIGPSHESRERRY